jgi:hypothetical protein
LMQTRPLSVQINWFNNNNNIYIDDLENILYVFL